MPRLAFALAFLAALGCGNANPPASDPERAAEILKQTLDAWKAGNTPESLAAANPPVVAVDKYWKDGLKLLDYVVAGPGKMDGFDVQIAVKLVTEKNGKKAEGKALFNVSTHPRLVVVRYEGG